MRKGRLPRVAYVRASLRAFCTAIENIECVMMTTAHIFYGHWEQAMHSYSTVSQSLVSEVYLLYS